jgi:hypothetical protein
MRLLHHTREFRLSSFQEEEAPPYAILSHTWGEEEVTFEDLKQPEAAKKLKRMGQDPGRRRPGLGQLRVDLDRHVLHRQVQQCRAQRGHQLHVSLVPAGGNLLCVSCGCETTLSLAAGGQLGL